MSGLVGRLYTTTAIRNELLWLEFLKLVDEPSDGKPMKQSRIRLANACDFFEYYPSSDDDEKSDSDDNNSDSEDDKKEDNDKDNNKKEKEKEIKPKEEDKVNPSEFDL